MTADLPFPSLRARAHAHLSQTNRTMKTLMFAALAAQAAHFLVLLVFARRPAASNVVQAVAPILCATLCLHRARLCSVKHQAKLWLQLAAAFLIWAAAQLFYLSSILPIHAADSRVMSDVLWLAFAFPLLLVAAHPLRTLRVDPVSWLDTAQSCLLFCILFILVYPYPGILRAPYAYHIENVATLLAVTSRYSVSQAGEERIFFRNVVIYTAAYALCSALASVLGLFGVKPGTLVDLCWTLPFTAFSVISIYGRRLVPKIGLWTGLAGAFPTHLHGISALGMAVMTLAGSAILARHSLLAGIVTLIASTLLFALRTSTREWQLHAAHARLQHTAFHDPLTGLANRNLLKQELTSRVDRQRKASLYGPGDKRTGLVFIDLDRFKTINDGLGHVFGDKLLMRVAELLRSAVRPADVVARHGGDEFVVLLDQVEEQEAEALCQRVNEMLREPLLIDGRQVHVTASIGLVMSGPSATAESMLQDADCAMYNAKGMGKDRARTFAPTMLIAAKRRLSLETDLRASLALQAVEVQYQPIYRLASAGLLPRGSRDFKEEAAGDTLTQPLLLGTGADPSLDAIVGFEALARWRHPLRGMISPADFIPIAEDTGLIIDLGKQVLYQACCQCQAWNRRHHTRLAVGVNVSALQFAHPGLLEEIKAILEASGLDPRLLHLEITESVLLNGYEQAEEVLSAARGLGINVCLDDFGTGYSSLSYLLHFPFDSVKIDRSFVHNLDSDHRRAEMVRMVIQLAASLQKEIVAEGIESAGELARLRQFGCDMVQGFLLSRPLTSVAVEQLLSATALASESALRPAASSLPQGVPWGSASGTMLPARDGRTDLSAAAI